MALQEQILTGLAVFSAQQAHAIAAASFLAFFHLSGNVMTHYEQTLSASAL